MVILLSCSLAFVLKQILAHDASDTIFTPPAATTVSPASSLPPGIPILAAEEEAWRSREPESTQRPLLQDGDAQRATRCRTSRRNPLGHFQMPIDLPRTLKPRRGGGRLQATRITKPSGAPQQRQLGLREEVRPGGARPGANSKGLREPRQPPPSSLCVVHPQPVRRALWTVRV